MSKSLSSRIIKAVAREYRHRQISKEMHLLDTRLDGRLRKNNVPPISDAEFADVRSFWKPYLPGPVGKQYYSLLKYVDPKVGTEYPLHEYLSESIMFSNLMRRLNPKAYYRVLSDKSMFGTIFQGVNRPYEYLRVCSGNCLDGDSRATTKQLVIERVMEEGAPIVIKKSRDSHGGLGVSVLMEYDRELLEAQFDRFGDNFVVQKWVKQSEQMSRLNATSLNSCRVITLLLNNRVSILAHTVRVGGKGNKVDNVASGGINVGITSEGVLTEGMQDEVFHIRETPDGMPLKGYKITSFNAICDFAKELHWRIPLCAIAGWDVCLDSDDNPMLIEVNLTYPDVQNMQMITGPIFKDRFAEVIDSLF